MSTTTTTKEFAAGQVIEFAPTGDRYLITEVGAETRTLVCRKQTGTEASVASFSYGCRKHLRRVD